MKLKFSITTFILLFFADSIQSQELVGIKREQRYISLKSYKKFTKGDLSKVSPSDYIIRETDTLVPIPKDYKTYEGVRVAYEPKDSIFLETYKDLVYRKHHTKNSQNESLRMRYWKDEIKIFFAPTVDENIKNELQNFAKLLDLEVDSLKISFVNNVEKSNYIIYSVAKKGDYQYNPNIGENKFDFYANWNEKQQLYKTELQLYPRYFRTLKSQITISKVYFLKSLGFFNSTTLLPKDSFLSSFSSSNKRVMDSDLDFLKYHYSYGICKGTKLDEFEEAHQSGKKLLKEKNRYLYFVHKD